MISALIKMNIQGVALSAMPFYFTKKFLEERDYYRKCNSFIR